MIKKIITIVGARPQFIKAAVVSRAFKNNSLFGEEKIIHTGQHFDHSMSDIFFNEMDIPKPTYNLDIHSLSHGAMTGRMLEQIESILLIEKPDTVLVYGDTNSTLAGALAAVKLHIPVAHVEAGLRSFNNFMPEEINRIITDRISSWLFCPTDTAVQNLKKEGIGIAPDSKVIKCGDVMQDAALFYKSKATAPKIKLPNQFALCTVHRAENTDNKETLLSIFKALEAICKDLRVVLPLHPRTRQKLESYGYNISNSKLIFTEPFGYLEMVYLLDKCSLVLTDSGGLQKESYFFGKYGITLREQTEWIELVESGYNFLCGSDFKSILSAFEKIKPLPPLKNNSLLYGDGKAGEDIVKHLTQ